MVAVRDSDVTLSGSNIEARYKAAHATATQRAEALLRTLNLWRDDPATPQPTAPSGAQPGAVDAAPTKGT